MKKIHDFASTNGYVVPTVFQGNYNPFARHYEEMLFPLLRELKMSFYAYSPIAGGFLVKSASSIQGGGKGRWDPKTMLGSLYHARYNKPALVDALSQWEAIADEAGISKAALAYRWVAFNSSLQGERGDGLVIGASSPTQLEQTLECLTAGPLDADTAQKVDEVWRSIKHEAPVDNFRD